MKQNKKCWGWSSNYRYDYQGQFAEHDQENHTGWHAFDLRMYDANIGRWISTDPYGQYASPYLAMGNNPVSGVDPDGGWNWATAAVGAGIGAGIGYIASNGDWKYAVAGGVVGGAVGGASFNRNPIYDLGGSEASSLMGITGYKTSLNSFGNGLLRTSLDVATIGARFYSSTNNDPTLYFDIEEGGKDRKTFKEDEYYALLRKKMNESNFKETIKFKKYSWKDNFNSWWNNDNYGIITVRTPSGVKEHGEGGHSTYYSNKGTVFLKSYFTTLDYVNATIHEMGHGFFGFEDTKSKGFYMHKSIQLGKNLEFTASQLKKIKNSKWGR